MKTLGRFLILALVSLASIGLVGCSPKPADVKVTIQEARNKSNAFRVASINHREEAKKCDAESDELMKEYYSSGRKNLFLMDAANAKKTQAAKLRLLSETENAKYQEFELDTYRLEANNIELEIEYVRNAKNEYIELAKRLIVQIKERLTKLICEPNNRTVADELNLLLIQANEQLSKSR
jgi:hypothetical protein